MAYIDGPIILGNAVAGSTGNNTHTSTQVQPGYDAFAVNFVVEAVGATPTITFKVQGSLDNVNWNDITYIAPGSDTVSVATQTATAVGTTVFWLDEPSGARFYKYFRLVTTLNTNVTYRCEYFLQDKS